MLPRLSLPTADTRRAKKDWDPAMKALDVPDMAEAARTWKPSSLRLQNSRKPGMRSE